MTTLLQISVCLDTIDLYCSHVIVFMITTGFYITTQQKQRFCSHVVMVVTNFFKHQQL